MVDVDRDLPGRENHEVTVVSPGLVTPLIHPTGRQVVYRLVLVLFLVLYRREQEPQSREKSPVFVLPLRPLRLALVEVFAF